MRCNYLVNQRFFYEKLLKRVHSALLQIFSLHFYHGDLTAFFSIIFCDSFCGMFKNADLTYFTNPPLWVPSWIFCNLNFSWIYRTRVVRDLTLNAILKIDFGVLYAYCAVFKYACYLNFKWKNVITGLYFLILGINVKWVTCG